MLLVNLVKRMEVEFPTITAEQEQKCLGGPKKLGLPAGLETLTTFVVCRSLSIDFVSRPLA